jgi:hypothetical protein
VAAHDRQYGRHIGAAYCRLWAGRDWPRHRQDSPASLACVENPDGKGGSHGRCSACEA